MRKIFLLLMAMAAAGWTFTVDTVQHVSAVIIDNEYADTIVLSGFTEKSSMVPLFASWSVEDGQIPCLASNTEIDIEILSVDSLIIRRAQNPAYQINVTIELVQFGNDVTVQSGTFAIAGMAAVTTEAISAVTLANSFCVHHRMVNEGGTPPFDSRPAVRMTSISFNSTTELEFRRGSSAYDYGISGHWWVVSSASLSVQHGSYYYNGGLSTEITQAITAVDLSNTFLLSTQSTTNTVFNGETVTYARLSDVDEIAWRRYYGVASGITFEYQVVTDTSITVQRGLENTDAAENQVTISEVDLSLSAVKTGAGSSNSGNTNNNNFEAGSLPSRYYYLAFNSTTEIELDVTETDGTSYTSWEVVEFTKSDNSTHYILTMTNDGNGTTFPTTDTTVDSGTPANILASPSSGYKFLNWTVTSGTVGFNLDSSQCTLSTGDATIQANFTATTDSFTVDTVFGAGCTITTPHDLTVKFPSGTLCTLWIEIDPEYKVTWPGGSYLGNYLSLYYDTLIINVQADTTVTATSSAWPTKTIDTTIINGLPDSVVLSAYPIIDSGQVLTIGIRNHAESDSLWSFTGDTTWYMDTLTKQINDDFTVTITLDTIPTGIMFRSTGATWNPRISLNGANFLWVYGDDSIATAPADTTPDKNYGTAANRWNRLVVSPFDSLKKINLGYDGGDAGGGYNPVSDYHDAQGVDSVTNITLAADSLYKFYASNTDLRYTDFTNCINLDVVEFYYGEAIGCNLTGCTSIRRVCFENCDLLALDVSDCSALEDIRGRANEFTHIVFPDGGLENLWHLCIGSSNQLDSVPPMSLSPAMDQLWTWDGNIRTDIGATTANTVMDDIRINGNEHTTEQLEKLIDTLLAIGDNTGVLHIQNNAGGLTRTGIDSILVLQSRGWTVNYDTSFFILTLANDGNGTTSPATDTTVVAGTPANISATPLANYHFLNWTVTSGTVGFNLDSSQCTLSTGDATIQANFGIDTVYCDTSYSGGATLAFLSAADSIFSVTDPCSIEVTFPAGYRGSWTGAAEIGSPTVEVRDTVVYNPITTNRNVTATAYEWPEYTRDTILAFTGALATVSIVPATLSPVDSSAACTTSVSGVTEGYRLDSIVSVRGGQRYGVLYPATRITYTITANTVDSVFISEIPVIPDSSTLTITQADNGTITTDPTTDRMEAGEMRTIEAVPDLNYHFGGWTGHLADSADNPVSYTYPASGSYTASALFYVDTFHVAYSGPWVSLISPDNIARYGDTVVLACAPPSASCSASVWPGGLVRPGTIDTLKIYVTADTTVVSTYQPDTVTLTLSVTGDGTIDTLPTGKLGRFECGEVCTLIATNGTDTLHRWTGAVTGIADTAIITMDADKTVNCRFYNTVISNVRRTIWRGFKPAWR